MKHRPLKKDEPKQIGDEYRIIGQASWQPFPLNFAHSPYHEYRRPIPEYEPSEMDLLALESMWDEVAVYFRGIHGTVLKGAIVQIRESGYEIRAAPNEIYSAGKIFREPPEPEFKKGDKVMVSDDGEHWHKQYFTMKTPAGAFWCTLCDTWTIGQHGMRWKFCRRPTEEELKGE